MFPAVKDDVFVSLVADQLQVMFLGDCSDGFQRRKVSHGSGGIMWGIDKDETRMRRDGGFDF